MEDVTTQEKETKTLKVYTYKVIQVVIDKELKETITQNAKTLNQSVSEYCLELIKKQLNQQKWI